MDGLGGFNHRKRMRINNSMAFLYTIFRGEGVVIPVEASSNGHHIGSVRELARCGHQDRTPVPSERWVILRLGVHSIHSPRLRWSSFVDHLRWVQYGLTPSRFWCVFL